MGLKEEREKGMKGVKTIGTQKMILRIKVGVGREGKVEGRNQRGQRGGRDYGKDGNIMRDNTVGGIKEQRTSL